MRQNWQFSIVFCAGVVRLESRNVAATLGKGFAYVGSLYQHDNDLREGDLCFSCTIYTGHFAKRYNAHIILFCLHPAPHNRCPIFQRNIIYAIGI